MVMRISECPLPKLSAIDNYYAGHPGICAEVTRQWIRAQATGRYVFGQTGTMKNLLVKANAVELVAKQDAHDRFTDVKVGGLRVVGTPATRTGYGQAQFTGLRSRRDVILRVVTVPGIYAYRSGSAELGVGTHAFAFDSREIRKGKVYFIDPNQGEWKFTDVTIPEIELWWNQFWSGSVITSIQPMQSNPGIDYKNTFHKGHRTLVMYRTPY